MASLDVPEHPLVELLAEHFASLMEAGLVDVVLDEDSDSVELQSDEWTISLTGWPIRSAFIATDSATDSLAEHRAALMGALGPRDLAALASANEALGGELAQMLFASGDGISEVLAGMIENV